METSKKIALFSGIIFALAFIFSISMYAYEVFFGGCCDESMLITLLTTTGAVFGTTCAFYYNKARAENCYKIRRSFLKEKYIILKKLGMLDNYRAQSEIEEEFSKIENNFDTEESNTNQEITHYE